MPPFTSHFPIREVPGNAITMPYTSGTRNYADLHSLVSLGFKSRLLRPEYFFRYFRAREIASGPLASLLFSCSRRRPTAVGVGS